MASAVSTAPPTFRRGLKAAEADLHARHLEEAGAIMAARSRVLVYEDGRGWRYYWREGDVFAYMLRATVSGDLAMDCASLDEQGATPEGSIGCRWTPDLFDGERVRPLAVYEKGRLKRLT